jgi:hypothetical protein
MSTAMYVYRPLLRRYVMLCIAFGSSKNSVQYIQLNSNLWWFLGTDKTLLIVHMPSMSHFALGYVSRPFFFQYSKTLFFLLWNLTMNSLRLFFVFVFPFVPFSIVTVCFRNVSICYFFHFARVISERFVDKDLSSEIRTKNTQPTFSFHSCN